MIGVIGAGSMGAALVRGIDPSHVIVCDRHPEKLEILQGVRTTSSLAEITQAADVLLLAVKPDGFAAVAEQLPADRLLVSVMAGVSISRIKSVTGAQRVVRAMPNLGVQVGEGVTGWYASPEVTKEEREIVDALFRGCGVAIEVASEEMVDAVTAVSGSGPAYFFALCALLEEKAEQLGFSAQQARALAEGTCRGAGALLAEGSRSAAEWRDAVTSRGGTTEAALQRLSEGYFQEDLFAAVDAAQKRAKELGQ